MCIPKNRIAAGLPAAYPLYFNSLVFKRVASAFSAFFAFFIFSVASTSLISLSLNDVTTQSSNRALDVPTYGEQYTVSYIGYTEIEKVEKYDNEGRIKFTVRNTYSGEGTVKYGVLIKRGLASGTELTNDNAETDYTLGGAYATFRARDLNECVTIKPYIEIDGIVNMVSRERISTVI